MADLAGGQVLGVDALLELAAPCRAAFWASAVSSARCRCSSSRWLMCWTVSPANDSLRKYSSAISDSAAGCSTATPRRGGGSRPTAGGRRRWRGRVPGGLPRSAAAGRAGCAAVPRSWPARLSSRWFRGCGPAAGPPAAAICSARPARPLFHFGTARHRPRRRFWRASARRRSDVSCCSSAAWNSPSSTLRCWSNCARRSSAAEIFRRCSPTASSAWRCSAARRWTCCSCWAICCLESADGGLGPAAILPSRSLNCVRKRAELAAARDQAGGGLPRPDDQRAVGLQQFAGQGDEAQARPADAGQFEGVAASFSTIQVRPSNRRARGAKRGWFPRNDRRGPARRAGLRDRLPACASPAVAGCVEPEEAHAAAETRAIAPARVRAIPCSGRPRRAGPPGPRPRRPTAPLRR